MKPAKGKGTAKVTNEALKPADDRKVGKRKAAPAAAVEKGNKPRGRKDKKAKKDPNKPKRPPTAFFVFLEEFRKTFKKENPNANSVSAVGKAGGQKWRQMSAAEKAPYEAKAGKKKDEYGKLMNAYNNKQEAQQEKEEVVEEEEEEEEEDDDDEEEEEEEDDEDED
ncbi:High mobility group B protein 1 [Linum perenne]